MITRTSLLIAAIAICCAALPASSHDMTAGMTKGTPDIQSVGAATFAPHGILLVGDTKGAKIFAIATEDKSVGSPSSPLKVEKVNEKIAALLGTTAQDIQINDIAVNADTGNTFLTVSRGRGPDAKPVIVKVDAQGIVSDMPLKDVLFSSATIPNAPTSERQKADVTTDLQFVDGKVIVAGLSNEEFASTLRVLPFPFGEVDKGAGVNIYHAAHGRYETASPVRTLAVFNIEGQPNVLAAYQCTPLVKFPVADLKPGTKVDGKTVAELGNMNRPIDMIVYQKSGKHFLLIANSARGVMKVDLAEVDKSNGLKEPVRGGGAAGLPYETIKELTGVVQLDRLDNDHAVLLVNGDAGMTLESVQLP